MGKGNCLEVRRMNAAGSRLPPELLSGVGVFFGGVVRLSEPDGVAQATRGRERGHQQSEAAGFRHWRGRGRGCGKYTDVVAWRTGDYVEENLFVSTDVRGITGFQAAQGGIQIVNAAGGEEVADGQIRRGGDSAKNVGIEIDDAKHALGWAGIEKKRTGRK